MRRSVFICGSRVVCGVRDYLDPRAVTGPGEVEREVRRSDRAEPREEAEVRRAACVVYSETRAQPRAAATSSQSSEHMLS